MATPSLTYGTPQRTTVAGTSFTPTFPSGTGRVFIPVSCSSNTPLTTASTDWRVHRNEVNGTTLGCTWFVSKESAGASPGALVVTSAASTLFSTVPIRSDIVRTRFVFGAAVTGTGTGANPGIVDQLKSQAARYLVALTLSGTGTASVVPSGYGTVTSQAGATGGAGTFVADKSATSSSDDPGAWTHTNTAYIAQTIALTDAGAAWNTDWVSAVRNLTVNGVNVPVVEWADSLGAGATAATGGMAANQIATSRIALFAANFKAARASSKTFEGVGGGNVTSGQLNSYDNRRSVGTGWDTSRNSGVNSLGGGALTGATSGQALSFTPGGSWDRHRVLFAQYPSSPQYTTKVDSGTATTLLMNQATQAITWSPAVSGSGTTINITSAGASGYILAAEAWTNGLPQVSVFNCGWFGSTSTQNAEIGNFYSPPYVVAAIAPKLTRIGLISNDPANGVTTAQTIANNQFMSLVGLISGSVVLETPPYASGGTEASQDASFDIVEALADALCVGFFRITRETGWTSYATASANGFMTSGDNHCTTAGYADWAAREQVYMDPGAAPLSASLLTSTNSFPAAQVNQTLSAALFSNTATFYGPTVAPGPVSLGPPLLSGASTLFSPTVTLAPWVISPPMLTSTDAVYTPTVSQFLMLSPPLVLGSPTFYAATISQGAVTLSPPLLASTNTFYSPAISLAVWTLSPPLLSGGGTIYAPVVSQGSNVQPVYPPAVTATNVVFAPEIVVGPVHLPIPLLTATNVFYGASVRRAGDVLLLKPGLFVNRSLVFYPTVANDNAALTPGVHPLSMHGGATVIAKSLRGRP